MAEDVFRSLEITASALAAERARLAVIAQNIANASSLPAAPGQEPYRRRTAVFETVLDAVGDGPGRVPAGGVRLREVRTDPRPFPLLHRPGHPAADAQGWVAGTNVELPVELADLLDASRAYEANLAALRVLRQMLDRTLQITR